MKTYEDYEDYCVFEHALAAFPERTLNRHLKSANMTKHYEQQRAKERHEMQLGHDDVLFEAIYS